MSKTTRGRVFYSSGFLVGSKWKRCGIFVECGIFPSGKIPGGRDSHPTDKVLDVVEHPLCMEKQRRVMTDALKQVKFSRADRLMCEESSCRLKHGCDFSGPTKVSYKGFTWLASGRSHPGCGSLGAQPVPWSLKGLAGLIFHIFSCLSAVPSSPVSSLGSGQRLLQVPTSAELSFQEMRGEPWRPFSLTVTQFTSSPPCVPSASHFSP